jgi:hypothetical protein
LGKNNKMTKSWTELLGQPQPHDQLYKNEIIRPTDYFTLSDFGHRQIIWKTLWKFDGDSRAKEIFDIWIKENK